MRSEQEMFDLLLDTARTDGRIRAVFMNGSRTNPNAAKDIFQDYDIVYVVEETAPFIEDKKWIDRFGERLYMQYPEDNVYYESDLKESYGWLMQLADGSRLDLHVQTAGCAKKTISADTLTKILLDKDGLFPDVEEPSDRAYWVQKPTQKEFLCTCNEFFWCLNNVGKGLWRGEIPYVQDMLNFHVRPELTKVLSWKIGIATDFSCSIGKSGKDMWKWLPPEDWNDFLKTYASGEISQIWDSVRIMCGLFRKTSEETASSLGYFYDREEAEQSCRFLFRTRRLSQDARREDMNFFESRKVID